VEVKLDENNQGRTRVCRKSIDPLWNEEFRFEIVDDSELLNRPVEFKVDTK